MASSLAATVLLAGAKQRLHSLPPNGLNWEGIYIGQFMRHQWKAQYCMVLHRYIKMGPIKMCESFRLIERYLWPPEAFGFGLEVKVATQR